MRKDDGPSRGYSAHKGENAHGIFRIKITDQ